MPESSSKDTRNMIKKLLFGISLMVSTLGLYAFIAFYVFKRTDITIMSATAMIVFIIWWIIIVLIEHDVEKSINEDMN